MDDASPRITPEQFAEWRSPRFGQSNPERMTNPVWEWLIQTGLSAFEANGQLKGPSPFDAGPGWSFDRFGQSSTSLPDGRTILIGGEHEDHYDPDFYIYNDVVVLDAQGRVLQIFGYPSEIFSPTDFHTATLVGDKIIIIGCLGHPADRKSDVTPVAILDLSGFSIQSTATLDGPGWIHGHAATLSSDAQSVIISGGKREDPNGAGRLVENVDDWNFNVTDHRWQRLIQRNWPQWEVARVDGKPIHLWQLQLLAQYPKQQGPFSAAELRKELGCKPDLELALQLYHPPLPHESIQDDAEEFGVHRILVGGTMLRYLESHNSVHVIVESDSGEGVSQAVVADLVEKMSRLENSLCQAVRL